MAQQKPPRKRAATSRKTGPSKPVARKRTPAAAKPPLAKRPTTRSAAKPTTRSAAKPDAQAPAKRTRTRTRTAKPSTEGFVLPAGAQRASSVSPRKIEWLIENRIPAGKISLVAGRPGEGKSLFSTWLAAQVSQKHDVIYSNLEDDRADMSRPRLEAAGADLDRVHFWTPNIETQAGLAELLEFVQEFKVKLITVDPIAAHVRASIWNDQQIRRVLTPLWQTVLEPTGCAAQLTAHTTKKIAKSAHALEAIGGSGGGLVGAARAVFVFGTNPDHPEERVLAIAKGNLMGKGATAFEIDEMEVELGHGVTTTAPFLVLTDPDVEIDARKVLSFNGDATTDDPVKTAVATEWLTSYLMFGPRPCREIREDGAAHGFTWTTLRRAAQVKIGVESSKADSGPGKKWALPDGHPAITVANIAKPMFDAQQIDVTPGDLTVEDVLRMIDAGKNGGGS
jgi:putative DNA primase/helicase